MNEAKFTKGPWVKNQYGELAGINDKLVSVWGLGVEYSHRDTEKEANSNLIAAAPEMYAMIENLTSELAHMIERENSRLKSNITSNDLDDPDYIDQESIHEACVLLAKARGEK